MVKEKKSTGLCYKNDEDFHLFEIGVRFANPPTEELRFAKPEEADSWSGEIDATTLQNACPQTQGTFTQPVGLITRISIRQRDFCS